MNGMVDSTKWLTLALGSALLACGSAGSTETESANSGGTGGSLEEGSTGTPPSSGESDSAEGTGTSGADESGTTAVEPDFEPYPARGVRLSEVFANQGVGVPIVRDGIWVDGSGRNAALIPERTTLIRGYWELDEDFEPRIIMARLIMSYPDGTQEIADRTFEVNGPSRPAEIDSNMYFVIPGELLPVGVKFQIELYETEYGYEGLPEPEQYAYPPQPGFLGVEDKDLALKIVLVPVRHDAGPQCPAAPEVTDDEMQYLSDQLFMQNPVQRVEIERRAPTTYSGSLNSFSPLLGFLADLRAQDNADPAAYYYGVVQPCDGGAEGVGGQAISIPDFPTLDNAWTRVSMGRWYGSLGSTANTFVHEVGHTQGRRHVYCNGDEGGPDPSYPYEAGDLGVWGFGILDFTLYTPTNGKDYMTYCGNTWVSDWTWGKVLPFIEEITGWGAADAAPNSQRRVLVGLVDPTAGEETWFITQGAAEGIVTDGAEPVHLSIPGVGERTLEGVYGPMGDGDSYVVAVDMPPEIALTEELRLTREHEGQQLQISEIRSGSDTLSLAR
ncbi:MAG: hypothetical protein KUG77_21515 [Nannocystaceae bacterium]|nr:hypothetical protein [Nannocystaceae bacterium]